MAYVVNVGESSVELGKLPTFKECQKIVGGLVETVQLPFGMLLVNEEGLLMSLPVNAEASLLAGQVIVGNAVVLLGSEVDKVLG